MESRVSLQPAYVLHSRPFRNTSLLVDFLTLDYGRVTAVARGARRHKSRYRSLLQLFQPLLASFSGRSEVRTLTTVESSLTAMQLPGNRLFSGLYLNELLARLLHNQQEHKPLYRAYQQALLGLQGREAVEPVLRRFEMHLLAELGYALNLQVDCISGQAIQRHRTYHFTPELGFQAADLAPDELEDCYLGEHLIALRELDLQDAAAATAARRLLRTALLPHLGDKPLHSRYLFSPAR